MIVTPIETMLIALAVGFGVGAWHLHQKIEGILNDINNMKENWSRFSGVAEENFDNIKQVLIDSQILQIDGDQLVGVYRVRDGEWVDDNETTETQVH